MTECIRNKLITESGLNSHELSDIQAVVNKIGRKVKISS